MASQRIYLIPVLLILLALHPRQTNAAAAPEIVVPDPPAVELPAGASSLGADDPEVRALIAAAHTDPASPTIRITAELPRNRLGVGVWRVIWTAWDRASPERPVARRESAFYVVPHGMVPVALSGKPNATAGNNAVHIARDRAGYVHMVWNDSFRPGAHAGAVYRRAQVLPDGTTRFNTETIDLGRNPGTWTAMPALAVMDNTVHFAWQADGTARYRALTRTGDAWHWSDEADTKAASYGRDTGPSIAVDANGIHILTPSGIYASSHDGGKTWASEPVPFGTDVKTTSLALDSDGRPLVAASSIIDSPPNLSEDVGHGGYWTIRLMRRLAAGAWERIAGPVDGREEWARPSQPNQDVLCDWVRVLEDRKGGIHIAWHGTAVSRIYGNDRAYYAWRSPDGVWSTPVALREPDRSRGIGWSYAPSLALDGDNALTLFFYATYVGSQDHGFDSSLRLFRNGQSAAPPFPVTRFGEDSIVSGEREMGLSVWFPATAPALLHGADGTIRSDVLLGLSPTAVEAPSLIVWDSLDLTDWLKAAGTEAAGAKATDQ